MASSNPSRSSAVPADAPRPAFAGDLAVFSLVDVIQLVCVINGVHRVVISLDDREIGWMLVAAAEVVSAQSLGSGGDEAFVELSRLPAGLVQAFPTTYESERDLPRLSRSWQELALEAARLEDEERRDSTVGDEPAVTVAAAKAPEPGPPLAVVPPAPPSEGPATPAALAAPAFGELYREAVSAYVHRDYARALALFDACLAQRPDDQAVRHNLQRLAKYRGEP